MGTTGSKKSDEVVAEPRKAFSDDDIFRHSSSSSSSNHNKRHMKTKQTYFNDQPLRPKRTSNPSESINKLSGGKTSFWNRKSRRGRCDGAQENGVTEVNGVMEKEDEKVMGDVIFRKLTKIHNGDGSEENWGEESGGGGAGECWSRTSVYRSYDCLNASSTYVQDEHLSRSLNPLVSSKLPFMLSYELKPSLVAQLNSIKSPSKDKHVNMPACNTNATGYSSQYVRQLSVPETAAECRGMNDGVNDGVGDGAAGTHRVDISRYLIDTRSAKKSNPADNLSAVDKGSERPEQDEPHKELTKTLAKLVNKAGTHEYRKFCNLARAYSVDFSDIYIADFLESVEVLAKLAKPVSTPTVTPTASPYRRGSYNPSTHNTLDPLPKTPRTNPFPPNDRSPGGSKRGDAPDPTRRTQAESDNSHYSNRSATLVPDCLSLMNHKNHSRIPIPIGTKMMKKEFQNNGGSARTPRNGTGHKHLLSVQSAAQKEFLSSIEEVQEAGHAREKKETRLELMIGDDPPKSTSVAQSKATATTSASLRPASKCCCFCEETMSPVERMDTEILGAKRKSVASSDSDSQFDVDFFYVDKDTKKPTMTFEEVLKMKRNKRMVQVQEEAGPAYQSRPASAACRPPPWSRRARPISFCLLTDSSDRYVPVARLTMRKRCTCDAQMRRLCSFLESPGCCLAEATVAECLFEPAAILRLEKALEVNESLRILNLESCNLEDDTAMFLGAALRHNATLVRLSLARNRLGPRGVIYLTRGLARNMTLQDLTLDYNLISDEGCEALSNLLAGSNPDHKLNRVVINGQMTLPFDDTGDRSQIKSWLRKLSLKANRIGPTGATKMFSAIRHTTSLTELDMSGNQIEDASLERLCSTLLFNRSLKILKLDNCALTWKCCEYLRRPLKTNTDLSILSLDLNQLTDLGVSHLAEGLQYNRNLKELSLNMCAVTSVGLECLVSIIKSRTALRTLRLCYNDITILDDGAGFVDADHLDLNRSFDEVGSNKNNQNVRTSQALQALDECLRESKKNLFENFNWSTDNDEQTRVESRRSAPFASRHQGLSKSSLNSSLYRKMIMALKRNPSLRIVMWGNQRTK